MKVLQVGNPKLLGGSFRLFSGRRCISPERRHQLDVVAAERERDFQSRAHARAREDRIRRGQGFLHGFRESSGTWTRTRCGLAALLDEMSVQGPMCRWEVVTENTAHERSMLVLWRWRRNIHLSEQRESCTDLHAGTRPRNPQDDPTVPSCSSEIACCGSRSRKVWSPRTFLETDNSWTK